MKKTLIYLKDQKQRDNFKKFAESKGLSMSGMIRKMFTEEMREEKWQ